MYKSTWIQELIPQKFPLTDNCTCYIRKGLVTRATSTRIENKKGEIEILLTERAISRIDIVRRNAVKERHHHYHRVKRFVISVKPQIVKRRKLRSV